MQGLLKGCEIKREQIAHPTTRKAGEGGMASDIRLCLCLKNPKAFMSGSPGWKHIKEQVVEEGQLFLLPLLLNGRPMRSIKKHIGRAPITSLGREEKRAHLAVDHLFGELDQKLTPIAKP